MLTAKSFHQLQARTNMSAGAAQEEVLPMTEYLAVCRKFIDANLPPEYYSASFGNAQAREDFMHNLVMQFVETHEVRVEGYLNPDGTRKVDELTMDLFDQVQGLGILKLAFDDPEIDEIQINDYKTIFVTRKGVLEPYVDGTGRPLMFNDNDEIISLLNRIVNDNTGTAPTINPGNPIFNAKTAKEQYRINAVHPVANTANPNSDVKQVTSVVIRKFKEVKLTLGDLIKYGTITDKMGYFISLLGKAEVKIFCVGPTGSGKTTLLNIVVNVIPANKRIILVQNPTEITIFDQGMDGRNRRNAVHWEVYEGDGGKDTGNKANMPNLISNTLRATPEVIVVGESRAPKEFEQLQRASMTGHRVLSTFHAEDELDAVDRFASELSSASGASLSEAKISACRTMNIVITQYRFGNGDRRIMSISEILGYKDGEPIVNRIFEYHLTGETEKQENGLVRTLGEFRFCNGISESLEQCFYKAGVSKQEILAFIPKERGGTFNNNPFFTLEEKETIQMPT